MTRRGLLVVVLVAVSLAFGTGVLLLWPEDDNIDRIGIWPSTRAEQVRRWLGL
jgi:hypothetical protein